MNKAALVLWLGLLSGQVGAANIVLEIEPAVGLTPEAIEADINSGFSPPPQTVADLAYPTSARYLIKERLSEQDIAFLGGQGPRVVDVQTVLADVSVQPYVRQAYVDSDVQFSFMPPDPLFSYHPGDEPQDWQWGKQTLKLPEAWDYTQGGAYIGIVDTGLQVSHDDLMQNFRNHLSYNARTQEIGNIDELAVRPSSLSYGHGTHVAGIVAASINDLGVAGTCPQCSLMVGGIQGPEIEIPEPNPDNRTHASDAVTQLVEFGAQALNFSWFFSSFEGSRSCPPSADVPQPAICHALRLAQDHDVAMAAASGNDQLPTADNNYQDRPYINFPARDPRVIAVAAIDSTEARADFSQMGPEQGVVAPGVDVLSTFYAGQTWNANWRCGDGFSAPEGYGPCTGTSMAAPHITGLLGLARSANPLLSKEDIRAALIESASNWPAHDDATGYGIPDAGAMVKRVLGSSAHAPLRNRLTPLFGLYSGTNGNKAGDHFHTIVPQMAAEGSLQPRPANLRLYYLSDPTAPGVPGYAHFPYLGALIGPLPLTPAADVYVATTDHNPLNPAQPLVPIHRLSYNDGANNSDHVYTTSWQEALVYQGIGYQYDGTEGYIHDKQYAQPAGTVRLIRRYNGALDDHAIYPESKLATMQAAGYTINSEGVTDGSFLGYAYPNTDTDGDELVDGVELFAGTNPNNRHSDCDLTQDEVEMPLAGLPVDDPAYPQDTWVLSNQTLTTADQHYACIQITAGDGYHIAAGGDLTLSAGQRIVLAPGFSVAEGGRLSASIAPSP